MDEITYQCAISKSELNSTERSVLRAIASWADIGSDNPGFWLTVGELAHETAFSSRTVQRTLRTLEQRGWIEGAGLSRVGSVVYRCTVPA